MKFLSGHLGYALRDEQLQRNVRGLLKYLAFLLGVVAVYSVLFHVFMLRFEGQEHSWVTGIYWTLTVMSTLGFGDIIFTSDVGRVFSVVVLVSGIVLLLIVLPFAFIRYFYAPWLEARLRLRAPREVDRNEQGHVILCAWDPIARELAGRLEAEETSFYVLEEDAARATEMHGDGIPVVRGEVDDEATYTALRATAAHLILANRDDQTNTNVALTARDLSEEVLLVGVADDEHAVDVLQLSGCDHVLPLKQTLGQQLANRVNAGHAQAHVIGRYRDLVIAEFSVHETPLLGQTIAGAKLREVAGVSVVGVWERGEMLPPRPDRTLRKGSIPVVVGSAPAVERLDEFLYIYDTNRNPVVVLGGGKVGRAAARALKERSIPVHMVEKNEELETRIGDLPDRLVLGDAADRDVMAAVGVEEAPSILLTTNQDVTNVYLAAYARRLNSEAKIVSRITHKRNLAAIHRAGADITLSYGTLGAEMVLAILHDRPPVILGEGVGFHEFPVPPEVAGRSLRQSGIGERTGLTVVGIETNDELLTDPGPDSVVPRGATLLAIGTRSQVERFVGGYD